MDNDLANDLKNTPALQKMLPPGERLLWVGQPDPFGYIWPSFIIYIVAVPWTIFTFGWLYAVTGGFHLPGKTVWPYSDWIPWTALIAGLLLLVLGLWMLSAPWWVWRRGRRTFYAVTDRQALVCDSKKKKNSQTLGLDGKVTFKIADPEETVSDLDILSGTSKGILFRAVREPAKLIQHLSEKTTQAPSQG